MSLLSRLFGKVPSNKDSRDDYGPSTMPPSAEAGAILVAMNEEEKLNFFDILQRLQEWHESIAGNSPMSFHPEARAALWGTALAKIADHYRDNNQNNKALFFMSAAWNISRYPVFAYNLAFMSAEAEDLRNAKVLLETYLDEYRKVLVDPVLMLVNPEITEKELEDLAKSARAKLAEVQRGT